MTFRERMNRDVTLKAWQLMLVAISYALGAVAIFLLAFGDRIFG